MRKRLMLTLAGIAAMVLLAGAAYAGVPCAGASTVVATPDCGAYCPASDMDTVTVTVCVMDCYGTPLPGLWVVVDPIIVQYGDPLRDGHCFCPGEAPDSCLTGIDGCCYVKFSDFGGCDGKSEDGGDCGLEFSAVCEGVELGPSNRITTASPDGDADCDVDLMDFIYFAGVYGSDACCADYDCDGDVDLMDFISFAGHYGHICP
jgi:hypothetical protein